MAGDWMKVEKVTPDKPEIEAIADLLDIDPDAVFGKCFRIWSWFDDHTLNGNAPTVTKALLDRKSRVTGFGDAMEKVGWLIYSDEGLSLPNFDRHCGESSKQRALTAKRVAKSKQINATGNATGNGEVTIDALPREEKRREEKRRKQEPPKSPKGEIYSTDFLNFWASYPSGRKQAKGTAYKAWRKAIQLASPEFIITKVAEYAMSPKGRSEFVSAPAAWLNGRCWEDDPDAWQTGKKPEPRPDDLHGL